MIYPWCLFQGHLLELLDQQAQIRAGVKRTWEAPGGQKIPGIGADLGEDLKSVDFGGVNHGIIIVAYCGNHMDISWEYMYIYIHIILQEIVWQYHSIWVSHRMGDLQKAAETELLSYQRTNERGEVFRNRIWGHIHLMW